MPIDKEIKLDDYVHASRWSDQDPNDPWHVGYVSAIGPNFVMLHQTGLRLWPNAVKITGEEGKQLLITRGVYKECN